MYIGHIFGFVGLPVSIILFLNFFGITNFANLFGIDILLIASIGLILVQIGDVIDAHVKSEFVVLTWMAALILCFPAILYFISMLTALPQNIITALPIMLACFLFTEGLGSFFIGH